MEVVPGTSTGIVFLSHYFKGGLKCSSRGGDYYVNIDVDRLIDWDDQVVSLREVSLGEKRKFSFNLQWP